MLQNYLNWWIGGSALDVGIKTRRDSFTRSFERQDTVVAPNDF
jgi:hypothetical protein